MEVLFAAPLAGADAPPAASAAGVAPLGRRRRGAAAATVLERGGLRRLVFEPWRAAGPMFVQSERRAARPAAGRTGCARQGGGWRALGDGVRGSAGRGSQASLGSPAGQGNGALGLAGPGEARPARRLGGQGRSGGWVGEPGG